MGFAKEYTFGTSGAESLVYTSDGWSRVTVCNRGSGGIGTLTLNRKKRSAPGAAEDAFRVRQNVPIELILGHGDVVYVQGDTNDLMEVTAGQIPFGQVMGPPSFPAKAETRRVPLAAPGVKAVAVNPNEFCQVVLQEVSGFLNGYLLGINKSVLVDGQDVRDAEILPMRFKLNRGDTLYLAGKNDACEVSMLFLPLPTLGGLIGELVC